MYTYIIGSHIAFALSAVVLGTVILMMTKGTAKHKLLGRIWVVMMTVVAAGSFTIHDLNPGGLSWIHALSTFTLLSMAYAIYMIRKGQRRAHLMAMIGCLVGLIIAGIFTLAPNRLIGSFLLGV